MQSNEIAGKTGKTSTRAGEVEMDRTGVNRRSVLKGLGAASAASLAGCSGDDGATSGELGERVPTVVVEYWADASQSSALEEMLVPLQENYEDLGLSVEIQPKNIGTSIGQIFNDARQYHVVHGYIETTPDRTDPDQYTRTFAADYAGGNGLPNYANWANCEFTIPAVNQQTAASVEERQELVTEAHSIFSEEAAAVPIIRVSYYFAANTDRVNTESTGQMGMGSMNYNFYIDSSPVEGDTIRTGTTAPALLSTTNFPSLTSQGPMMMWMHLVSSTLVEYDQNLELENMLASGYEMSDDGTNISFELREATFHNGEPITAEDVKFTFEYLNNNTDVYSLFSELPLESIEVIDERNIEFTFTQPYTLFLTKVAPIWGILHKETWVENGARDNPQEFSMDPIVGSGPFEVENMIQDQTLRLVPHDGHPVHEPDHDIIWTLYRDDSSARNAFEAGEIDIIPRVVPTVLNEIKENMGDVVEEARLEGMYPHMAYPHCAIAPGKFSAFRKAIGKAFDRQQASDIAYFGNEEPILQASPMLQNHPFAAPEEELYHFTDDVNGDIDDARATLEEEGWGWDGDGRLHYPPDADLEPLWPEGESASADDFPCLDEI